MLDTGDKAVFSQTKTMTYVKPLGKGAWGEMHLFHDDTIHMDFAIKKYAPQYPNESAEEYRRFTEEIKVLFSLSHPNIVRAYDYYLYPLDRTGYLIMEYVSGTTINHFECGAQRDWNDIFLDTLNAFCYLEEHRVLHGDIRADNIMIDEGGKVKIIDFGFSRKFAPKEPKEKGVFLNWPSDKWPNEIRRGNRYTRQSELYFLGLLFKSLPIDDDLIYPFRYMAIVDKMCMVDPLQRYQTFHEVAAACSDLAAVSFTPMEKQIYQRFAAALCGAIDYYEEGVLYIDDTARIASGLSQVLHGNALEQTVQRAAALVDCFVVGTVAIQNGARIDMDIVKAFYRLFVAINGDKQRIMIDNLINRLAAIQTVYKGDLPF